MQTRIFLLNILVILLTSCGHQIEVSQLAGIWSPTNNIDSTGLNISEEIIFDPDGKYHAAMYSNEDSIVYSVIGNYSIDIPTESINIKFTEIRNGELELESIPDSTYSLKIIELTDSKLILETLNGTMAYKKKQLPT